VSSPDPIRDLTATPIGASIERRKARGLEN